MKKILILGGSGLLGTNLSTQLKSQYQIISQGFSKKSDVICDLRKQDQTLTLLKETNPNYIINTIAETSVERCEKDPLQAFNLNVLPVINLLKALKELNKNPHIIQISTDHFYNKQFSSEENLIFLNNYALTKYWAERELKHTPATILRTNFFGGDTSFKLSFSGWALKMLTSTNDFMGFNDVFFSPLHVNSLGDALIKVLEQKKTGIFNLGASTELSKYEFIQKLAQKHNLDGKKCKPTKYLDSNIKIPRPYNMSMNISKFEKTFQHKLPSLTQDLERV